MDCIAIYKMINIFNSKSELAQTFCEKLIQLSSGKEKLYIALSGGSTPKIIFQSLSKDFNERIDWKKIHLFWGDERCVLPESPESNYGMTKKNLLNHIQIPEENIHRIKGEDNPEEAAARYSDELRKYVPETDSLPRFDIVMLGLGEDGHTASIFPDQMKLLSSEKICDTAIQPFTKQKRITLTSRVINNSEWILFLVTVSNKAYILSDILNKKENYKNYPASHIEPLNGILEWYIDKDAADFINRN
jgi:6-phosphogluconolactonase